MARRFPKKTRSFVTAAALVAAALAFLWLSANQDDYYRASLLPADFTAAGGTQAPAWQSPDLMLEAGRYTVTVACEAAGKATVEIISALEADAQGSPLPVLAQAALAPGQNEVTLSLELAKTTRGVRITLRGDTTPGVTVIASVQPVWRDTAFFMLSLLLCAGVFAWVSARGKRDGSFPESLALAVCAAAGLIASLPALRDFFVYGHDLAFHLTRIESIKDGLLSGQFPVRISPTFLNGYGYASSVMYGDLPLYIPALFRLCGVSMMVSWQAFIVLLNTLTAYLTYRAVKSFTGNAAAGLITASVFTLGVYRLMTLYTRAAAGEALAMLFYPMVIVGIAAVVRKPAPDGQTARMTPARGVLWLVAGMTGMLQTHLISFVIAALGCGLFTLGAIVLRKTSARQMFLLLASAGITALINLWFLVPFFSFSALDLDIFHQEKQIWLHAAYLPQLFASFVNPYAGMTTFPGTTAEMPLSVGLLQGMGLLLFLFAAYAKRENRLAEPGLYATGRAAAGFAALALCMASVLFPWTYVYQIPVLGKLLFTVQFPWRYLGAASALLSITFAAGACLLFPEPKHQRLLVLGCLLLSILNAAPLIDAAIQAPDQTVVMADKEADFAAQVHLPGDYFFEGTDVEAYLRRAPVPAVVSGDAALSGYEKDYLHISFDYTSAAGAALELPLYRYPLYAATLNGKEPLMLSTGDNNILVVHLPAGGGRVSVSYSQPWTFTAADLLSLLSLLALGVWGWWKRWKQNVRR